jgi:AhpD family alkylhydroperoxidase
MTMSTKTTKDEALTQVKSAFGFVPNLMAGIVEQNPAVAAAYLGASAGLEGGLLSATEKQVVMLAVSAFNDCHYCSAAHRTAAKGMGVAQSELELIDEKQLPSDKRLKSLVEATWDLMTARGWLGDERIESLGVSRPELYELIAIVGLKTISNYINHIQLTEVDTAFKAQAKREIRRVA